MTYRYKHSTSSSNPIREARRSIREDLVRPKVHYDPDRNSHINGGSDNNPNTIRPRRLDEHVLRTLRRHGSLPTRKIPAPKKVFEWQRHRFDGTNKHNRTHGQLKGNIKSPPAAANISITGLHNNFKIMDTSNYVRTPLSGDYSTGTT